MQSDFFQARFQQEKTSSGFVVDLYLTNDLYLIYIESRPPRHKTQTFFHAAAHKHVPGKKKKFGHIV